MDFKDLVSKRQSCRNYSDKVVSREDLINIVETARLAPSACNSQPWKFIIADQEMAKLVPPLLQDQDRPINRWSDKVSSFIIICETKAVLMPDAKCDSQHYAQMDLGIVTAHLSLAAADKGLSTCIVGYFHEPKLKVIFKIPDDVKIKLILAVGYAGSETIRPKARKPFEEIASFNSW